MFTSILIATDGSAHSERAVELGSNLAAQYQADLSVIHVMGKGPLPKGFEQFAEVEHLAEHNFTTSEHTENITENIVTAIGESEGYQFRLHQAAAEQIVRKALETAKKNGVPKAKEFISSGEPVSAILDLADNLKADTIVMGTRGMSELKSLVMGSVSHKVCSKANAACITVK